MGWFNKKYIYKEKIFTPELSKIYSRLIIDRDNFDYTVSAEPKKEDVLRNLENAKIFINKIKPYVLNRIEQAKKEL
ncbi:MAG TPA: hypothetical protein DDW90_07130 [Cyanobacteria bacterium UBA9971]|nr:hypothetical protein [Cyanobacteria bacterium UBA9971]